MALAPTDRISGRTWAYGESHFALHALGGIDLEIAKGEIVVFLCPLAAANPRF